MALEGLENVGLGRMRLIAIPVNCTSTNVATMTLGNDFHLSPFPATKYLFKRLVWTENWRIDASIEKTEKSNCNPATKPCTINDGSLSEAASMKQDLN